MIDKRGVATHLIDNTEMGLVPPTHLIVNKGVGLVPPTHLIGNKGVGLVQQACRLQLNTVAI